MVSKIQEIADVVTGYAFRQAIESNKNGNIFVFQAKDIDLTKIVTTNYLTKTNIDSTLNKAYLKENDILIVSRGMKSGMFKSTVFKCSETNVVASSSLHIIRIKDQNVLPDYVSLYLNSIEGQNAISQLISGSYIGALPRSSLAEMKIPIPTLYMQKSLIDLQKNIKEQNMILERKKKLKEDIINATFTNLIKK